MKSLDLKQMGVQELDAKEMKSVDGGNLALGIAILGAAIYLYNNREDFIEGVKEGYAKQQAR